MKQNSIRTRNDLYFQLLAIADTLWDDNFRNSAQLSSKNKEILKKMEKIIAQMALE